MAAVKEEEGLRECQQHDGVNDGEGEHVTGDHAVDHRHERSSQTDGSGEEHEEEPGGRQGEDQDGFFQLSFARQSTRNARQCQDVGRQKDGLGRIVRLRRQRT